MRLRRSVVRGPGLRRVRRGRGFSYHNADGTTITDAETLQRIKDLVIPPAWKKVWISPHANDHIQAVGTDVAGRRQYMYHQAWQEERAEEKFDRVLDLSLKLPEWRSRIAEDLAGRGLKRDRVLALALHLLDRGYFRAGGEQYAEEHESYGLATLQCDHVTLRSGSVAFDYPAKSGVQRTLEVEDAEVVRAIRSLLRRADRTERLLVCRTASGWVDIRADDLNATVQRTGRRRVQRQGSPHLARHGARCGSVRRRGPASIGEGGQARRVGGDERGLAGAGKHAGRRTWLLCRPEGGQRYQQEFTIAAAVRRQSGPANPTMPRPSWRRHTRTLIRKVAKS